VCARQPCYHVQAFLDVGQWLCVPPFRVVCPFRASYCLFGKLLFLSLASSLLDQFNTLKSWMFPRLIRPQTWNVRSNWYATATGTPRPGSKDALSLEHQRR
jgi:hypothetical protein